MSLTTWEPCRACGATTRHDNGVCIRNPRHPYFDVRIPPAPLGSTEKVSATHNSRIVGVERF